MEGHLIKQTQQAFFNPTANLRILLQDIFSKVLRSHFFAYLCVLTQLNYNEKVALFNSAPHRHCHGRMHI